MVLRVTERQFSLLKQQLRRDRDPADAPDQPRAHRRRKDLPENQLEGRIASFLGYRGFITVRQHVGTFVPYRVLRQVMRGQVSLDEAARDIVRIGEQGAADWWSARPVIPPGSRALDGPHPWAGFFWEAKAPGRRPTEAQLAWLDRRRQVGLEAAWFNRFQAQDRLAPASEARVSHVFETWFLGYFNARKEG